MLQANGRKIGMVLHVPTPVSCDGQSRGVATTQKAEGKLKGDEAIEASS